MTVAPRIGTVLSLPGVALAELAGAALELAWIDLEHGALGPADVPGLAIALRAAGCEAHVRLPAWDSEVLGPVLDAGVDGVVAPGIERAEDAAALVRRLRYPPGGTRGYGPRRAGGYGRDAGYAAAGSRVTCTMQVESPAGLAAVEEIAAVEGVDVLVVGCADLSLALGAPHDLAAPALRLGVARAAAAARGAGIAFGLAAAAEPAAIADLAPHDTAVVLHSADVRLYARAVDQMADGLRAALSKRAATTPLGPVAADPATLPTPPVPADPSTLAHDGR